MTLGHEERYEAQSKISFAKERTVTAKWLSANSPVMAVTLTYRSNIKSKERVECDMKTLNNKLRKKLYPKSVLSAPKFNRGSHVSIFYTIEQTKMGRLHVHAILLKPPYEPKKCDIKTELINLWEHITHSSDNWAEITDKKASELYIEYSMKDQSQHSDNFHYLCWDARN